MIDMISEGVLAVRRLGRSGQAVALEGGGLSVFGWPGSFPCPDVFGTVRGCSFAAMASDPYECDRPSLLAEGWGRRFTTSPPGQTRNDQCSKIPSGVLLG